MTVGRPPAKLVICAILEMPLAFQLQLHSLSLERKKYLPSNYHNIQRHRLAHGKWSTMLFIVITEDDSQRPPILRIPS